MTDRGVLENVRRHLVDAQSCDSELRSRAERVEHAHELAGLQRRTATLERISGACVALLAAASVLIAFRRNGCGDGRSATSSVNRGDRAR